MKAEFLFFFSLFIFFFLWSLDSLEAVLYLSVTIVSIGAFTERSLNIRLKKKMSKSEILAALEEFRRSISASIDQLTVKLHHPSYGFPLHTSPSPSKSPLPQYLSINGQSTLPPPPPRSEHPFNPDTLLSVHVTYPPPPSIFQPPLPQTTPPTIPPESSEEDEATSDNFASQESDSETVQMQTPAKPNQAPPPQPKEQSSSSGEEDSRSEIDSALDEPTSKSLVSKLVAEEQKVNGRANNARSKPNAPDPVTPTIPPQPTKAAPPEALPLPTTPTSPFRLQTAPSAAELKFSPPFLSAGQRVWLCGEPPPFEANLCEMANSEESNPLLPNQEGGKEELGLKDEKKSAAPIGKSTGAPLPAAIPVGWTADGLPVAASMMERSQWDSGLFSVLGRNDDFCSSDLEVCLLGSVAPCVLYGSNVERLGSAPGTFANHCLPYTGLYFLGNAFFGWNCLAPWFSYPIRTAIRRKFNLEGSCEAVARSCGCCGSLVEDEVQREQCETACDFATHVFCHACAVCQEGREIRRRLPHPAFNAQPLIVMIPPGEQNMGRGA